MATHSCILAWRIPMDRDAWRAIVHGVRKSWTQLKNIIIEMQIKTTESYHLTHLLEWLSSIRQVTTGIDMDVAIGKTCALLVGM